MRNSPPSYGSVNDSREDVVAPTQTCNAGSLDTIGAAAPVRAVIELNGGTAARLGLRPGDRVIYPIFGSGS